MAPADEVVALYDDSGRPCGSAPRSRMRAENLRHGGTAVVVRDPLGRVYVHRRTETKDVYPGHWDFGAGGVLLADEDPDEAARREAAEELGVTSPLRPLGESDYADDHTRYHAFLYETTYDGPIRWQAEEVAFGEWVTLERLAAMIEDPAVPVMPDAVALLGGWLGERLADVVVPKQGWDSVATIVEGRWVDRVPQRPDVARRLLAETRLLPLIAGGLGLTIPVPVVLDEDPLRVRHPLVPGVPCVPGELTADHGARIGAFIRALHDTTPEVYADSGVPSAEDARQDLLDGIAGMRARVLPLLPSDSHPAAEELLTAVSEPVASCLVHGDLGPEHVLVTEGEVTGVIDWSDAIVGDPAVDLSWTVHGTAPAFAEAVVAAYGASPELVARGRLWFRFWPWWDTLAGVDFLGEETRDSGLAGIRARL